MSESDFKSPGPARPGSVERPAQERMARFGIIGLGVLSLCVLLGFVLRSGPTPIYDEPNHLETVYRLEKQGLTVEYLRGASLSSPGPLYAVVQTVLRPLTGLRAPAIRVVNIGCLLATMLLLWWVLWLRGSPEALSVAVSLLAAPTMWVISGLALTEMPAMACAMLGTFFLLRALRETEDLPKLRALPAAGHPPELGGREDPLELPSIGAASEEGVIKLGTSIESPGRWALALVGGLAAGAAVTGRQAYLALFLAAPLLVTWRNWKLLGFFLAVGAVLPGILFGIWGGISPPLLTGVTEGISISHGILALAYAGAMLAIFTVRWFSLDWRVAAVVAGAAMLVNVAFRFVEITPAFTLAHRVLPEAVLLYYSGLAGGVLFALAVLFVVAGLKNAWAGRTDREFIFFCVCGGLLCLTAMKVTVQFSSRYVATAMPWLLLAGERYWKVSPWLALRLAAGDALGVLMLASYFAGGGGN